MNWGPQADGGGQEWPWIDRNYHEMMYIGGPQADYLFQKDGGHFEE